MQARNHNEYPYPHRIIELFSERCYSHHHRLIRLLHIIIIVSIICYASVTTTIDTYYIIDISTIAFYIANADV